MDLSAAKTILANLRAKEGFDKLIKDRVTTFIKAQYKQCCDAKELVTFMVDSGLYTTREDALAAGRTLVGTGLLTHVEDEHAFKDEKLWYVFQEDSPAEEKMEETLSQEKNVLRSWVHWRDQWRHVRLFAVLSREQRRLFLYQEYDDHAEAARAVSPPWKVIPLKGFSFKQQQNKLLLTSPESAEMCIETLSTEDRDKWMHGLVSAHVNLEEDTASLAKMNFFDFKCADIDDNDIAFSKYKGQVCLVVNVASQ